MRFHVISLPHTSTTPEYSWCAYTQKVRHFCDMMTEHGHDVTLYAGSKNTAKCGELVRCTPRRLPPNGEIPVFAPENPLFRNFNERAIRELQKRLQPQDFICLIGGTAQEPVAAAFPGHMAVEFGIGYGGVFAQYRVWESYAWMHTVLGAQTGGYPHLADGRFYDTVIPNSFDPADFPLGEPKEDYLLFVGRLIYRKGYTLAAEIAERAQLPLHIAGAKGSEGLPKDCVYHGVVGPEERARLMGGARALIAPTLYVEPFGGVAVEAQMCGTPAITTDWGAFTETVVDGATGFRCHTMREFLEAVEMSAAVDREAIRARAVKLYSLDVIALQYERYFERLLGLWGDGFYAS